MQLPTEFVEKYQTLMGDKAPDFLASFDLPATHGFRLNPQKVQATLIQESLEREVPGVSHGYYGQIDGKGIDHVAGWLYSQDPSAMNVAQFANPQVGERVLDLCAAPGGKSTQLLALMQDKGLLVANEIDTKRARVLSSNLERWGAKNAVVTNNSPEELAQFFAGFFDRIIVDAPCSGEGLFRKDPKAMTYWSSAYVQKCAQRQRDILQEAVKMLRPGGYLIYSTCTFAPEEDEQNIAWLLQNYDLKVQSVPKDPQMDSGQPNWGDGNLELAKAVRLFPQHYYGEGHFICVLQNQATKQMKSPKLTINSKLSPSYFASWQEFQKNTFNQSVQIDTHLYVNKQTLYQTAWDFDTQMHPKILRNGLKLGEFKKQRFEPNHALVMALHAADFKQVIDLSAEQYQRFIHGEALLLPQQINFKGFVAVSYQHKIFSWGKLVQQQLKNFYPKGLRQ
ncbi:RsmB/NOP family class I SAM-dependent RNA methyltransferase [Bombilactobacillus thymidiniphilus]|uniref:RsmF rRNA methyltransferase first C-terminal domain-containing protein n=1 Tax=Bombilactobacillus thymidiniphilus TaxID=2923363 RepID=A0ABY4PDI2_9LACO|nr:RsmB/NOP family class I SAM-dependent RNA methyltransferase [Bombilactobacillus thymidiniphilus]UQS83556.1 RsmF rRNA methyltransferase first C-terminal domain-containing protein [Bombilactobacillus thymidiniphilus]